MADWAEARSRFLLTMWFPGGHDAKTRKELAVALRQARLDALEEAAKELKRRGFEGLNIVGVIRSLKEKQP